MGFVRATVVRLELALAVRPTSGGGQVAKKKMKEDEEEEEEEHEEEEDGEEELHLCSYTLAAICDHIGSSIPPRPVFADGPRCLTSLPLMPLFFRASPSRKLYAFLASKSLGLTAASHAPKRGSCWKLCFRIFTISCFACQVAQNASATATILSLEIKTYQVF
eukprot:s1414_g13.t1